MGKINKIAKVKNDDMMQLERLRGKINEIIEEINQCIEFREKLTEALQDVAGVLQKREDDICGLLEMVKTWSKIVDYAKDELAKVRKEYFKIKEK